MSTPIESLELKVESTSGSAVSGIDALADSLGRLRNATKGGLGLGACAKQLDSLSTALSRINSSSISNLKGIGDAIKTLSGVKVSATVANQITALGTAINGLDTSGFAPKIQELTTALQPLLEMGKSNLSSFLTPLRKLPETIQALNSVDMGAFSSKIQELTTVLKPLADEMQQVANGFSAFPNRIQRLITDNERLTQSNGRVGTSYINLWAKCKMAYNVIKTGAKTIAGFISKSNDYIENVNLFNVSMGEYAGEARQYAEQVGELMGIDPGEWMRNQGVFMTLATGFGVTGERANIMSKNLTQLGYDLSSFFNLPYEDAMQKLQSGLAGELEPLRRIGYDLSVARLQQEAYTLGINKKVSAMTQAEKAELRYHAILTQVTVAQGDMARTLNAPANQLRIFNSQIEQAGRAIGNIFIPLLNKVLPYLIALAKVVKLVADVFASLFGFEMPEVDYSGVGGLASGAENASSALGDAANNAKKLKQYTMGFDELNVIDPNSGSGSDSGAGVGGSGFDFELPDYSKKFLEGVTNNKVAEIVEKMKEWLGLTGEINTWADFFDTNLGQILILVGEIGLAIGAWKLATGLMTGIAGLKKTLKGLGTLAKGFKVGMGATIAVTGIAIEWTGIIDAFRNGLDGLNFAEILGGGGLTIAGGAIIGQALGSTILGAAIGGIVAGIPMFVTGVYDAIVNGLDMLSAILIPAGATMAGAGIGAIIGMIGGPIGAGIGALIGLAVGALTDLGILIYQKWDEIKGWFSSVGEWFNNTIIQPIKDWLSPVTTWFDENIIQPIVRFISGIVDAVSAIVKKIIEIVLKIVEIAVVLGKAFYDYVIAPIVDFVVGLAQKIYDSVVSPVVGFFAKAGSWFYDTIISPIWDKIVWLKDKAIATFKKVGTTVVEFVSGLFKSVINGILSAIERTINGFIKMLNGAIDLINEIPGVSITKVELLTIPKLAEGGMINGTGQAFIAREAGPELVGTIGRRTAVVNNDQIVESISYGVANANEESNSLLREQNSLLRAMLEKESGVYLDGKQITKSVENHQRQRGRVLVTGGAY